MQQTLFVGNIPYGALESELSAHFERIGPVHEVKFIIDWKRGRFRGYGFVTMDTADATQALEKLSGIKFQDRILALSRARPARPTGETDTEMKNLRKAGNY
jgi:RNA recognition motif-containing protein